MIKNFIKVFVLAAFLVAAVQTSANAATITFHNQSGWTITGLYITNNNDSWGSNRLGGTIENGYSREVSYDYHNGRYAVRVYFANGNYWTWGGNKAISLNGASTMTIYYERTGSADGFRLYAE